jgi:hypothetical protein
MKNRATIHMGASVFDVHVRAADGTRVTFDLYHMEKDGRRKFVREFVKAFRESAA